MDTEETEEEVLARIMLNGEHIIQAQQWLRNKMRTPVKSPIELSFDFNEYCDSFEPPLHDEGRNFVWSSVKAEVREKEVKSISEEGIKLHTWEDIDALSFPANPWRVKNLLPLEGFVILASESGVGKSFVSMELAQAITTPRSFAGESSFNVIGANVLYIDAEMSKSELQRRGRQMGFSEGRKHKLLFVSQDDVNLKDDERTDLDELMLIVEKEQIKVVFVDTTRAVAGGMEENRAEEVRKFFNRFKPFKDIGVCVVFLDHLRKGFGPNKSEPQKDSLLASQDKTASVEVLLMLHKKPNDSIITVFQRKNRLGPEIPPFDIQVLDTNMDDPSKNRTVIEYWGEHNGHESKLEKVKEIILAELAVASKTRQELIELVQNEEDVAERTIQEALVLLRKTQKVHYTIENRKHRYSLKPPESGVTQMKIILETH